MQSLSPERWSCGLQYERRLWVKAEASSRGRRTKVKPDRISKIYLVAMSLNQIGSLSATPMASDSGQTARGGESTAATSASAVWISSPANIRVSVQKQAEMMDRLSPSPPMSPVRGGMRADLSVVCQALMEAPTEVREHRNGGVGVKEEHPLPPGGFLVANLEEHPLPRYLLI